MTKKLLPDCPAGFLDPCVDTCKKELGLPPNQGKRISDTGISKEEKKKIHSKYWAWHRLNGILELTCKSKTNLRKIAISLDLKWPYLRQPYLDRKIRIHHLIAHIFYIEICA